MFYMENTHMYLVWVWVHFSMLGMMWGGFQVKIAFVPDSFRMTNDSSLVSTKHFYLCSHERLVSIYSVCMHVHTIYIYVYI